jgi:hypothetical protein
LSQSSRNFILGDFCACDFIHSVTNVKCFVAPCTKVVRVDESIGCHKFTSIILEFATSLHPQCQHCTSGNEHSDERDRNVERQDGKQAAVAVDRGNGRFN